MPIDPLKRPVNTSKRPEPPKFPVWDPDGVMHEMTREQCNDVLRHGTHYDHGDGQGLVRTPWTSYDPKAKAKAPEQPQRAEWRTTANAPPTNVNDKKATPKLDALRKELSEAGIAPDPTWGVAHMEKVLQAKRAGATSLPKTADEIADEAAEA